MNSLNRKKSSELCYLSGMRKLVPATVMSLAFGISLNACSDSKVAGGGPSGTEAGNAITAQIIASGTPAAQVTVRLTESESVDSDSVRTAITDSKGKVSFENVSDGEYILEASMGDRALQKEVVVEGEDVDLGKGNLEKTVSVSGSVHEKSGKVKVRGMAHEAEVVDGKFTLDSLPAGPLSLVFIPDDKKNDTSCTYMKVIAGESSTASTFAEESRALLLDDFQDSNYQNRFMPAHTYDGGWWYFDYSEENVTPSFTDSGYTHRFSLESEDGNIVAHVAATFGDVLKDSAGTKIWPWATVGIELGKSDKALCNDISSVDTVAFKAKGEGAIEFGLIDETQKNGNQTIAKYEFTLGENWDRISVPLKEILDPQFSYTCVNQIVWSFKPNNEEKKVEFWLDDIELTGGKRLSIWKK